MLLCSLNGQSTVFIYENRQGEQIVTQVSIEYPGYQLKYSSDGYRADLNLNPSTASISDNITQWINIASQRFQVNTALIKAVIQQESNFEINATSSKGAAGLMQLMPDTAAKYGLSDRYNPQKNINTGTEHLSYLLQRYNKNLQLALAAYNAGETSVDEYAGIPPFPETEDYVKRVLKFYSQFQQR